MGNPQHFSRITITPSQDGTWALGADGLPGLARCRTRLVWRFAGEQTWRDDFCSPPPCGGGNEMSGNLEIGPVKAALKVHAPDDSGLQFGGCLTNTADRPIELSRFHFLDGFIRPGDAVGMLLVMQQPPGVHYYFPSGQEAPPIRQDGVVSKYWWDNVSSDEKLLPDVIYDEPNWVCGMDSAVLCQGLDKLAWIIGSAGPGIAFGEVGLRSAGKDAGHFYAGQLLDNILLAPGENRELEKLLILAGDWQEGLRKWAAACAGGMGATKPKPQLSGFCSWYHDFAGFSMEYIDKAIEEFAELPIPPGGRMIQIDDGFQRAPGDWRPNERFPQDWWAELPARIAATGSIPSLWMAPLVVLESNPIVNEHPEWFQRLPDGRFAITMMNWGWCEDPEWKFAERGGLLSYSLDPDHPGARAFMGSFLKDAVKAGWRAFKFDFNAFSSAKIPYDHSKTLFETMRGEYRFFRETVGPDVHLNACLGVPWRYAVGYADSQRIGGDMVGEWECIRKLLPVLLMRMAAFNGIWWTADPDVFYMRHVNTTIKGTYFDPVELSTSEEEQSMLLTAIGVMGGMLYTSDLPSEWTSSAREKILKFWSRDTPSPVENPRLAFDPETNLPVACKSESTVEGRCQIICALFNWAESEATVSVSLEQLGLDMSADYDLQPISGGISLERGMLVSVQPPHSARCAVVTK